MKSEEKNINSIAGVVLLYNPDKDVIENILSYIDSIDFLYIIDNSKESSEKVLNFINDHFEKIEYVFNQENIGVASALNIAVEKALNDGFHYLLTMDQDSMATPNMVERMLSIQNNFDNVGIISPTQIDKFHSPLSNAIEINEKLVVMTSGNLLNLSVFKIVGPFNEELFIDFVDVEYCLRLKQNNFKTIQIKSLELLHSEGNLTAKSFLGKTVYPHNHAAFRWYYKTRNLFYINKLYGKNFPQYFSEEFKLFRNNIIKIILFESRKREKLWWMIKGFYHFKKNRMGKYQVKHKKLK